MTRILSLVLFTILLFSSCSPEPDFQEEQTDTTAPVLYLLDSLHTIEAETTIRLQVSDTSEQINTTVRFGGEIIFESSDKSIDIPINPFNYKLGSHVLQVNSVDSSGNESQIERLITVKHMLLKVPISNLKYFDYSDHYIVLNDAKGKLIDYKKAEAGKDVVFYGDGSVVENFTASLFLDPKEISQDRLQRMYSFADIAPGTILNTSEEHTTAGNNPTPYNLNKQSDLIINYPNQFGSSGTGYAFQQKNDSLFQLAYSDIIDDRFSWLLAYLLIQW